MEQHSVYTEERGAQLDANSTTLLLESKQPVCTYRAQRLVLFFPHAGF